MGATIGEILRELRLKKNKTLEEAAIDIGITRSALGNYENNIRVPRDNIKVAISDYYQTPVQNIFFTQNTHET